MVGTVEHYEKQETRYIKDEDYQVPGTLANSVVHMKVNPGSKIRNLVEYAKRRIKEGEVKQLTWNASGKGTTKAISCAEIIKRLLLPKIRLHQITTIRFQRVEEIWKPKIEGLDVLKVNIDIPAISILLSKEPLDTNEPGYQPPGPFDVYWRGKIEEDKKNERKKKREKCAENTNRGDAEVKFAKKHRPSPYANKSDSARGEKESKQRKNEKRRASEETRSDKNECVGDKRKKEKPRGSEESRRDGNERGGSKRKNEKRRGESRDECNDKHDVKAMKPSVDSVEENVESPMES